AKKVNLSTRLEAIVQNLPIKKGMRILEIGCGPGAAARAIANQIGDGYVLAIDRSEKAIAQAKKISQDEMALGCLGFRQAAIEDFELEPYEELFDLAFAVRVGALDGRHPETGKKALHRIGKLLKPGGKLFVDGGDPIKEVAIGDYQ